MFTMFEIAVGIECGGIESGLTVREYTDLFDIEINIFQPIEKLFEEVRQLYNKKYQRESDYIGCRVLRIVPEDEAKKFREEESWIEAHSDGFGNVFP